MIQLYNLLHYGQNSFSALLSTVSVSIFEYFCFAYKD